MDDRFEQVFRRAYPRLVALAWHVLGDAGMAEDVAQESLVRLADAAVLDRPDHEVDAWLTRVCLNRALNVARSRRRSDEREDLVGRRERDVVPNDPAGDVVAAEERDAVRAALALLSERQQAVLVLRHSGYRYAEIAAAVDVAPASVGTLLARAEKAFRRAFEPAPVNPQEAVR